MILSSNSKVLIVHRRMFENDHSRYFIGRVEAYENGIAKVTGTTWIYDVVEGKFSKKQEQRTKILSLTSGSIFCYELPTEMNLNSVEFVHRGRSLELTDHKHFSMDLSENYRTPARLQN